jgi:hypothetical protein
MVLYAFQIPGSSAGTQTAKDNQMLQDVVNFISLAFLPQ